MGAHEIRVLPPGRTTAGVLADLIEAAVDTLARAVAVALPPWPHHTGEGLQINDILNKRA